MSLDEVNRLDYDEDCMHYSPDLLRLAKKSKGKHSFYVYSGFYLRRYDERSNLRYEMLWLVVASYGGSSTRSVYVKSCR